MTLFVICQNLSKISQNHIDGGSLLTLTGGKVPRPKLTKRQAQAKKTKKKIHKVALQLMTKKGFNNTTIAEISQKANVSVGTFYLYFQSKEDIFLDIYHKADEYFRDEVADELADLSPFDQVVRFFKCYAKYNDEQGVDAISQLYNTKNKLFIAKDRYMHVLLEAIIQEGQDQNLLSSTMTARELADYLFIVARGTVYDWCLHDADYDLERALTENVQRLKPMIDQSDGW